MHQQLVQLVHQSVHRIQLQINLIILKKTGIIIGILGLSFGVSTIVGVLGYKFYKKRQYNRAIPTPGNY